MFNLIPTMEGWVLTGREKWNGKGREGQEGKRMERLVESQDFGVRLITAFKASFVFDCSPPFCSFWKTLRRKT